MELYAIRHLPTEWNKKGILQGKRDISISEITPKLQMQIEKNTQSIKSYSPYDIILTSSLKRTAQTALLYGYKNCVTEPLINELDFGDFEGEKKQLLIQTHKFLWYHNPVEIELGEELLQFENRLFEFLQKYKSYRKILLFGHGAWIRGISSIKTCGTISQMNKVEVPNNSLIQLNFSINEIDSFTSSRKLAKNGGF